MTSPVAFFTQSLGGYFGADLCGADLLDGLLAADVRALLITAWKDRQTRAVVRTHPRICDWLVAPRTVPFPKRLNARLPRRLASWAKHGLLDPVRRRRLAAAGAARLAVVNGLGSHPLWRSARHACSAPAVLAVQESPGHFEFKKEPQALAAAVDAMAQYHSLIFASSRCRDKWLAMEPLCGKPAFYVPNSCDEHAVGRAAAQDRRELRSRLGLPADPFVIVCVASLQARKGQDLIVDAWPELARAVPEAVVYLVGPVLSDAGRKLLDRIRATGLADRIIWTGARPDALDFIRAADCLLLPSRAEAMPRVVLEAMALNTPVVASDVDGIPEMIEDGVHGHLFPIDRPDGMVQALAHVAGDPDAAAAMAQQAARRYRSHFSRAQLVERFKNVFNDILRRPGAETGSNR